MEVPHTLHRLWKAVREDSNDVALIGHSTGLFEVVNCTKFLFLRSGKMYEVFRSSSTCSAINCKMA